MIKFFTILFLVYYTAKLFKQNIFMEGIDKNIVKISKELKTSNSKDILDKLKENGDMDTIAKCCLTSFFILLPITVAEFFYIFFATQYGNKIITVGYLIWWVILFIVGIIKNKLNKNKELKYIKFSIWRLFLYLIDVAYFGYMYYILFLV